MEHYEADDVVTFYFVIVKDGLHTVKVQAWTDNKQLAKFYMDFHHCKNLKLKSVTDTYKRIVKMLNENANDEITIQNKMVVIRNEDKSKPKYVQIPITASESVLIDSDIQHFYETEINYSLLNNNRIYFKDKYVKAMKDILLLEVINNVINGRPSKIIQQLEFDYVAAAYKSITGVFE